MKQLRKIRSTKWRKQHSAVLWWNSRQSSRTREWRHLSPPCYWSYCVKSEICRWPVVWACNGKGMGANNYQISGGNPIGVLVRNQGLIFPFSYLRFFFLIFSFFFQDGNNNVEFSDCGYVSGPLSDDVLMFH